MNTEHHGPHCAGSCEGQAYSLRIKNLESENQRLRAALKKVVTDYLENGGGSKLAALKQAKAALDTGTKP